MDDEQGYPYFRKPPYGKADRFWATWGLNVDGLNICWVSESLPQCWNKSSMFRVGGVVRPFTSCMHQEQLKTLIHWPSFQFTHFNLCRSLSRIFASIHASNPRHKSTKQNYNKARRICITQNRFRKKHMKRWNSSLFFPCFVVLKTCLYDLVSWMVQNAVPPTSDRPAEAVGSLESQDDWDAFAVASAPPGFDHLQLNFWGKEMEFLRERSVL